MAYKVTAADSDGTTIKITLEDSKAEDGFTKEIAKADWDALSGAEQTAQLSTWVTERATKLSDVATEKAAATSDSATYSSLIDTEVS